MRNDGKPLEKTIQLIEETLKESENTQIFRNYKIENSNKVKREFDVFIKSKINDYEINIAIECKDYKTKVSLEKIEAFHSKCDLIKNIHRKIFISNKGYQSGVASTAKSFGIELLTAEKLTPENFSVLPPVYSLTSHIEPQFSNIIFSFCEDSKQLSDNGEFFFNGMITNISTNEKVNVYEIFTKCLNENYKKFQNMAFMEWMKIDDRHSKVNRINIPCELIFEGFSIENVTAEQVVLKKANFDITINISSSLNNDVTGRVVKYDNDDIRASTIKIQLDENTEGEIVFKGDDEFETYLTENDNCIKLQTLFTYNRETNKITKQ
ncbi:restriction endonuclease [Flavobacterium pectinovorum]|uniref:restriction endonuclease n=1 Tax=Flavobacterium pectinovorum TaxID=29533 RepID=UPI00265EDB40|nr:restriction endonuclease [Flavobacterium pectinovorum]WKL47939.1 restriction endonuclease [Flavobacterium pectinovorum]